MTDYSSVKSKLLLLLGDEAEGEGTEYDGFVHNAVDCISPTVDEELQNDERVIFYCAARALYDLRLVESMGADYVTSFKAGDVSFTRDSSVLEGAEKLLETARAQCSGIIGDGGFSFKAV